MKLLLSILFSCSLFTACFEEEKKPNFNKEQMMRMLQEAAPDLVIMVPPNITTPLVHCQEYLPPCRLGYKVKIKNMEVTGLLYDSQEKAFKSAKSMQGYYLRNWAFDQVAGEPILERLFEQKLGAKKAD